MAGNATRELVSKLGMKSLSKGVKVDVLDGVVTVSLMLNLKYGYNIKETTPCCRSGHAGGSISEEDRVNRADL